MEQKQKVIYQVYKYYYYYAGNNAPRNGAVAEFGSREAAEEYIRKAKIGVYNLSYGEYSSPSYRIRSHYVK